MTSSSRDLQEVFTSATANLKKYHDLLVIVTVRRYESVRVQEGSLYKSNLPGLGLIAVNTLIPVKLIKVQTTDENKFDVAKFMYFKKHITKDSHINAVDS